MARQKFIVAYTILYLWSEENFTVHVRKTISILIARMRKWLRSIVIIIFSLKKWVIFAFHFDLFTFNFWSIVVSTDYVGNITQTSRLD